MFNKEFDLIKEKIKKLRNKLSLERSESFDNSKDNPETSKYTIDFDKPAGEIHMLLRFLSSAMPEMKYILDVGAHSTAWIRNTIIYFPGSTVYLIEPLIEMEAHLKKFCEEFSGSKYFLNGAGEEEGILLLTLNDTLEGANFLMNENKTLQSKNVQREVKVITIDSLIEKNEIELPQLVKLDVQGFELNVLRGAKKLFGSTEVFILEVSMFEFMKGIPIFSDVISFMTERGYEVYDFSGFLRRPYDNALGQVDICFVKKDGIFRNSNRWYKPKISL